jgi:hypothetical protein
MAEPIRRRSHLRGNTLVPGVHALILAILLCCASRAPAAEEAVARPVPEAQAPRQTDQPPGSWDTAITGSWWPRSGSADAGGDIGMSEEKVRASRRYRVTPTLSLTPEIAWSRLQVSAPATARLPSSLQTAAIGLRGDYRPMPHLTLTALLSPGLAGDFRHFGGEDIRFRLAVTGRYAFSDRFTLLSGFIYQQGYQALPVFPVVGAIFRPDEQWTIALGAPRTGVIYAPVKELRLYLGGEYSGNEYQLHDTTLGAKVIRYREVRAAAGADFTIVPPLKGEVTAGFAFARKFQFYDLFDATRQDIDVDPGPFVRAGLSMEW